MAPAQPLHDSNESRMLYGSAADIAADTGCEVDEIERMAEDCGMFFQD